MSSTPLRVSRARKFCRLFKVMSVCSSYVLEFSRRRAPCGRGQGWHVLKVRQAWRGGQVSAREAVTRYASEAPIVSVLRGLLRHDVPRPSVLGR